MGTKNMAVGDQTQDYLICFFLIKMLMYREKKKVKSCRRKPNHKHRSNSGAEKVARRQKEATEKE